MLNRRTLLKNKRARIITSGLIAISSIFCAAHIIQQNKTISVVGDYKIKYKDISKKLKVKTALILSDNPSMERTNLEEELLCYQNSLLEEIENNKILEMKAKELNLITDDNLNNQIKSSIESLKESFKTKESYLEFLKENNIDEKDLYIKTKNEIIYSTMYNHYIKNTTVTEEELLESYEENLNQYIKVAGGDLYHIVSEDEDTITEVYSRLGNGEDFKEIASEINIDYSVNTDGHIGYYYKNSNVEEKYSNIKKILDTLEEGTYTAPVKTEYGYHIFMIEDIISEDRQYLFEEIKESVEQNVKSIKTIEKINLDLNNWRKELVIKK